MKTSNRWRLNFTMCAEMTLLVKSQVYS